MVAFKMLGKSSEPEPEATPPNLIVCFDASQESRSLMPVDLCKPRMKLSCADTPMN